jgi:hypothetical protein
VVLKLGKWEKIGIKNKCTNGTNPPRKNPEIVFFYWGFVSGVFAVVAFCLKPKF